MKMPTVKSKGSKLSKPAVECRNGDDVNCAAAATSISSTSSDEEMKCCTPRGCRLSAEDILCSPADAVKVVCNNDECNQSGWMHMECFEGK